MSKMQMIIKYTLLGYLLSILFIFQLSAQNSNVFVDKEGVMNWEDSKKEVHGFGVNYTAPFAHAFRSAKRLGINVKDAIDQDIYHFSRLGFDLYRIHVWDTEISDSLGNLIKNEQLDTFDYLISQLKDKGINYVLTPIAFWGDGWPEPDRETPGFSHKYGKPECLTDPDCITAQENYLYQFLNHKNPYTGLAYKNDPGVIAFEVSNEPHHRGEAKEVTEFVNRMVKSMKKTGTKKPIFYNMSHAIHFSKAYFKGGAQGGTFQWYPTGLGYGKEVPGNLLPNVNDYAIPFESDFKKYKGAKLVYEFDAADVGRSYIYPAMARSFREAGIQIATHFAYDPSYLAYANTEYNTHYMNLAYTPQKALSLMIASEVFHQVPLYSDFGEYPQNTSFQDFKVDYMSDLAIYNGADKLIYTNTHNIKPKNQNTLSLIAGWGNSPLVKYDGTGAYFLNKIENGIWRLEVMPDALCVENPFGKNSPEKTVGVIKWTTRNMQINLDDLASDFSLKTINDGNDFEPVIEGKSFQVKPGTYLLIKNGVENKLKPESSFGVNKLKDFYAPKSQLNQGYLVHKPHIEVNTDLNLEVKVQFIAPEELKRLKLFYYNNSSLKSLEMKKVGAFTYVAEIPKYHMTSGYLKYNIVAELADDTQITYPAAKEGIPTEWDFYDQSMYETKVVPSEFPLFLFEAKADADDLIKPWRSGFKIVPTSDGRVNYHINIQNLFEEDEEDKNATPIYDYTLKHSILDKINGRSTSLSSKKSIILNANALNGKECKVQVALVLNNGASFGTIVNLKPEKATYEIELTDLKPVKTVTLPRPYPSFLPYYLEHSIKAPFDINKIENIQISIGPGLDAEDLTKEHGFALESILLK